MRYTYSIFITLLFLNLYLSAQQTKINELRVVGNGKLLTQEIISNEIRDVNGEVCAGLSIQTDLTGLSFESNNGIVKLDSKEGEYLLFLSPNERVVKIRSSGFKPLQIILNDFGINLTSGKVWGIEVTGDKKLDLIPINILTTPTDVDIYIDNQLQEKGTTFLVSAGEHNLRITKNGYSEILTIINCSAGNNLFNFTLTQIEPVKVTIQTKPTEAKITLDGIESGNTDKDLFRYPGTYSLQLSKSGYLDINETINVKESGENIFSYDLTKNSVTLTLNITPRDAVVNINKENYSNRQKVELAPGSYLLEISKAGYEGVSEYIELELNKPITKNIALVQKTGSLQLTVQPIDASVKLKKGNTVIKSWLGSEIQKGIPVGNYTLEITKTGYTEKTKNIVIKEKETTIEDIVIEKGSSISSPSTSSNQNMVYVEGGTYQMGSTSRSDEQPVHSVTISSFYISKYEVTFAEYDAFCDATGRSKPSDNSWGRGKRPVVNVSWFDATAYCEWLSKVTGNKFRLPTEAEWEYAAKGGASTSSATYSGSNNLDDVGWYDGNSGNKTHEVGLKQPNELGIYDMSGNVWEWCSDWYDGNYYRNSPSNNPKGPSRGRYRVLRGGSWGYNASNCRSANRYDGLPSSTSLKFGFRIAQDK